MKESVIRFSYKVIIVSVGTIHRVACDCESVILKVGKVSGSIPELR